MKNICALLILITVYHETAISQAINNISKDISTDKTLETKTQPIFIYESKEELKDFHCAQNIFFWHNIKVAFDKNNNIIIAGIDQSKRKIHIQIRGLNSKETNDYYAYNPYADSLDNIPHLTSFMVTNDSNEYKMIFETKYVLTLKLKDGKLKVEKKYSFNNPELPSYNAYYYYKELYGIHPVTSIIRNRKAYFYDESMSVDILKNESKKNIYYNSYINPEFWNYGMSDYVTGIGNKLLLANALKNELVLINLSSTKVDTIENVIPEFKAINKQYFDSIYKKYKGRNVPSRLNEFYNTSDSFNYIFKIIMRSENEIWVIWKGFDISPHQLKMDILVFDIKTKTWKTKYHRLVYDYLAAEKEDIVTKTNYTVEIFNNLTYISGNKLFIITNDNIDFDPIGKTYKIVKDMRDKNPKPKSLKLYKFEIKDQ